MKKTILNSLLAFAVTATANYAAASEINAEQIGNFLCQVNLCKNGAVISDIKVDKYNLPNLAEKLAGNGKQVLKISFHQETLYKEYARDYTDCNLIVSSSTSMTLSSCKITGTIKIGRGERKHALSLGGAEHMQQNESGFMSSRLSTEQ